MRGPRRRWTAADQIFFEKQEREMREKSEARDVKPALTKPHLSKSQLGMLFRCGIQYEYAYVKGERRPPGIAALRGRAAHTAIEADLRSKQATGELLPDEQIRDLARDAVHDAFARDDVTLHPEDGEPKKARAATVDEAVKCAAAHHEQRAPEIEPIWIERPFRIEIPGIAHDLRGYIDLQEANSITDTKTSAKPPKKDAADVSEQLTLYALAAFVLDKTLPAVALDTITVGKRGTTVARQESVRTRDDLDVELRRIARASAVIEKGAFVPTNPDNWCCSARWCGWHSVCPYARRRVSIAV